jgi:Domain of unknown function (DUF4126)
MLETFQTSLQPLLTAAGLSWASGLRLYATLAVAGGLQMLGWVQLPSALALLGNPWVVGGASTMAAVEFFMDKIPGLDSVWDSIHTFLRIPAGIALAAGGAAGLGDHWMLLAGLVGGSLAATTHVAKAGMRLMINTSPEPFTNWGASFVEETLWVSMMGMMFAYPWTFGAIFAVVLVLTIYIAVWALRKVRGLLGRIVSFTNPKTIT